MISIRALSWNFHKFYEEKHKIENKFIMNRAKQANIDVKELLEPWKVNKIFFKKKNNSN
jgi:hypothetical protein